MRRMQKKAEGVGILRNAIAAHAPDGLRWPVGTGGVLPLDNLDKGCRVAIERRGRCEGNPPASFCIFNSHISRHTVLRLSRNPLICWGRLPGSNRPLMITKQREQRTARRIKHLESR